MYGALLGLGIMNLPGVSGEEQIRLFRKTGYEAFFVDWVKGMDLESICRVAKEENMIFQSIHAPFLKMADMWTNGPAADEAVQELVDCVRDCRKYQVPIMVVHAFIGFEEHSPNEYGVINFGKVVKEAEKCSVKIAFENTEGEEYLDTLMQAFAGNQSVGFCLDTGHEMCYNYSKDLLAKYGDRLIATHINDNLGISDCKGRIFWTDDLHLLPFDGIKDWQDFAARLDRCGYEDILTFELTIKSKPDRHENDGYAKMDVREYLAESYKRACRVAALRKYGNR